MLASLSVLCLAAVKGFFTQAPKNGFVRQYIGGIIESSLLDKPADLLGFIGATGDSLYFSTKRADVIYRSTRSFANLELVQYKIPTPKLWLRNFKHFVQGDSLFSWAPNVPALISISLKNPTSIHEVRLPHNFTRAIRMTANTFLLRSFDTPNTQKDQIFLKFNSITGDSSKRKGITKYFNDWGMLTDGILNFDSLSGLAAYVHFFSNEITWIDSNLNPVRRTLTIDTTHNIAGSTETYTTKGLTKETFNKPPEVVNLYSQIYCGYLFNYSAKKADNQSMPAGADIDIYSTSDGKYAGTLSLPTIADGTMQTFGFVDSHLIAIYKKHIVVYKIDLALFNNIGH